MAKKHSRSTAAARRKAAGEPYTEEDFANPEVWAIASGYVGRAGDPDPNMRRSAAEVYVSELRKWREGRIDEMEYPNPVVHEDGE